MKFTYNYDNGRARAEWCKFTHVIYTEERDAAIREERKGRKRMYAAAVVHRNVVGHLLQSSCEPCGKATLVVRWSEDATILPQGPGCVESMGQSSSTFI